MNKIIGLLALLLAFSACTEKKVTQELYDEYNGKDGFGILILPPSFVDRFVSDAESDQKELLKSIEDFRVMTFGSSIEEPDGIDGVRKKISKMLDDRSFETYMQINKDGSDIVVKAKGSEEKITEMHVLIAGKEQVVLASLTGNINLSKALKTINSMDGSEFEEIEKFSGDFDFSDMKWAF